MRSEGRDRSNQVYGLTVMVLDRLRWPSRSERELNYRVTIHFKLSTITTDQPDIDVVDPLKLFELQQFILFEFVFLDYYIQLHILFDNVILMIMFVIFVIFSDRRVTLSFLRIK